MHAKINSYLIQIILLTLPFVLPQFHIHDDNSTLLTAISLLFAILVGFFIAATTSNYLRLQTLIADANAQLISICNLVKIIEPNKSEEIVQAIDDYMISSLDYELLDFTDNTKKEFSRVLEIANGIEPKDDRGFALVAEIQSRTYTILSNNQESTMTAKRLVHYCSSGGASSYFVTKFQKWKHCHFVICWSNVSYCLSYNDSCLRNRLKYIFK